MLVVKANMTMLPLTFKMTGNATGEDDQQSAENTNRGSFVASAEGGLAQRRSEARDDKAMR